MIDENRREWIEIAAVAAVSFILYQINMFVLFLIPVQMLAMRRGTRGLAYGSGAVVAAAAILAIFRLGRIEEASVRATLLAFEIAVPAVFLGGLVLTHMPWPRLRFASRRTTRLVIVTLLIGVVSIPAVVLVGKDNGLYEFFYAQVETLQAAFGTPEAAETAEMGSIVEMLSNPDRLTRFAVEVMLRTYLFSYFILVGVSIWIGDFAAAKTLGVEHTRIWAFRIDPRVVWGFIASWALVLADVAFNIGAVRYAAWNVAMILLLLYGIQGVAIVRYILVSRGVSSGIRIALGISFLISLVWPGVNLLVMIVIPGLGVSETWINYRKPVKE